MNESNPVRPAAPRAPRRRLVLMGSVAALAVAALLGGPSTFKQIPSLSNPVQAA